MFTSRAALLTTLVVAVVWLAAAPGRAHKPITSPYTYNEDVYPVLRDKCGDCHVAGGVAPMSLLTHEDAVPWGESIRIELLAGYMPPWRVNSSPVRFHNVQPLSAREMDVVLTWATGGTPLGDPAKSPAPSVYEPSWSLGPPDLELPLPQEHTMAAPVQDETVEFVVSTPFKEPRRLRAVDLRPGNAAIVRSAAIEVRATGESETLLGLWVPGDPPVAIDGAAFELPASADLLVRVRYRKTWQFEREEMRDRSTLGLYFATAPLPAVDAISLSPGHAYILQDPATLLAVYPDEQLANADVVVTEVRPDGARRPLVSFHARSGWARRFWFREPVSLAGGTRIEVEMTATDDQAAAGIGAAPSRAAVLDPTATRVTLNVVPAR